MWISFLFTNGKSGLSTRGDMMFLRSLRKDIQYFPQGLSLYRVKKISPCLYTSDALDKQIILLDTSLQADNLGDKIIYYFCSKILKDLGIEVMRRIPTQVPISADNDAYLAEHEEKIKMIAGTNVVMRHVFGSRQWYRPTTDERLHHLCLFGVGLDRYDESFDWASKKFYRTFLDAGVLHSVRDSLTERALHDIGIENVVNTACPTMWNLTESFCKAIPRGKATTVVTTVTDYAKDPVLDYEMMDVLLESYDKVYVWLQGSGDLSYLQGYPRISELDIIPYTVNAYVKLLERNDIEYVGTRLHAGIFALNRKKRTLILAVDSRAKAIAEDTGLPVASRAAIHLLRDYIESNREVKIRLPWKNIERWKQQFRKH